MAEPGNALDQPGDSHTASGRDVVPAVDWFSATEAARRLGVNERTIRRAIARRELSATKTAGVYHVSAEALAEFQRILRQKSEPAQVAATKPQLIPLTAARSNRARLTPPPHPLTSLVGRERELENVKALLREPGVRLVTLTGPGGVGKTRLALALAASLNNDFGDGVGFVDLSSVRSPALVASVIAQTIGIREASNQVLHRGIAKQLGQRHVLLVIDNFEHVLSAAPLVTVLLTACPRLVVLATSRAPLLLDGERVLRVPPLRVPKTDFAASQRAIPKKGKALRPCCASEADLADAAGVEAVRLFVARAAAVREGFALTAANVAAVTEICRHLDGLPLAIELAAARCAVLSPSVLLSRLDDRMSMLTLGRRDVPARMRSLREAVT